MLKAKTKNSQPTATGRCKNRPRRRKERTNILKELFILFILGRAIIKKAKCDARIEELIYKYEDYPFEYTCCEELINRLIAEKGCLNVGCELKKRYRA